MSQRRTTAVLSSAVGVPALLLVLWAAAAGPFQIIGVSDRQRQPHRPHPAATATSPPTEQVPERVTPGGAADRVDLHWIGDLILWALVLLVCVVVAALLWWLWQHRWHRPDAPAESDVEPLPDVDRVARALLDDATASLHAISGGTPRNAVVACWLRLEEAVGAAGLPRERWETATEFTVRVLHSLDIDPRPIGRLAALFHEARFSAHPVGEDVRAEAERCLSQLYDDLGAARPPAARP